MPEFNGKVKITEKERDRYFEAVYKITTIIPLTKKPEMRFYTLSYTEFVKFCADLVSCGEFIVSVRDSNDTCT